ncbi:MAG: YARHG domain-containing protein [Coriobacteriales bacterium]
MTPGAATRKPNRARDDRHPNRAALILISLVAVLTLALVPACGSTPASDSQAAEASGEEASANQPAEGQDVAEAETAVDPNQVKIDEAVAAGKQVYAGTIHSTTNDGAWKMLIGTNPNDDPNYPQRNEDWYQESLNSPVTLFVFDQPASIEGYQYDGGDRHKVSSGDGTGFGGVGANMGLDIPDSFASYDGQHVVMAFLADDVSFPTDVSRIKAAAGEVLLTGDTSGLTIPGSGSSAAPVSESSYEGDYVLPESSTRVYPVDEIRGMNLSKEQLRIARNEIFARHGRGFNDAGLQNYFNSKSWYKKVYEAGEFEEDMLSSVEKQNVDNIKAVEG